MILKSDNGSVFGTVEIETLLHHFGVLPLFSPRGTPSYNGAIEAGIHSLKERSETHAAGHGRPGAWTYDDVCASASAINGIVMEMAKSRKDYHDKEQGQQYEELHKLQRDICSGKVKKRKVNGEDWSASQKVVQS